MAEYATQIRGIPLMKFQSEDRIKQLQQGQLYMKTLRWYRDNAKISDAIGDDYEGMLHINEASMYITPLNGGFTEIHELNNALFETYHSNDFVFCMFGINPNAKTFQFTEQQKNKFLEFGETSLLILDSEEFCNRVRTAMVNGNIDLQNSHCGFITYYDEMIDSDNILASLIQGMHNVAFQKRMKYEYQQEYRMLIPNRDASSDHYVINIGDISDISKIIASSKLLNSNLQEVPVNE